MHRIGFIPSEVTATASPRFTVGFVSEPLLPLPLRALFDELSDHIHTLILTSINNDEDEHEFYLCHGIALLELSNWLLWQESIMAKWFWGPDPCGLSRFRRREKRFIRRYFRGGE